MKERIAVSALLNRDSQGYFPSPADNLKPFRKRIGQFQLIELQHVFDSGIRFPDKDLRGKLSERLRLSPRTVQVWFQNRRQSCKVNQMQIDLQTASILQSLRLAYK